jgi:hypothetical protein
MITDATILTDFALGYIENSWAESFPWKKRGALPPRIAALLQDWTPPDS